MNASAALLITVLCWGLSLVARASIAIILVGICFSIGLRYYSFKGQRGLPTRDTLFLIALFPTISLLLYQVMFYVTDVKSYLDSDINSRYEVQLIGCNYIYAMLTGGAIHLISGGVKNKSEINKEKSLFRLSNLLFLSWFPLGVWVVIYFVSFYGREYVEIHNNTSVVVKALQKTIYLSYPSAFLIARLKSISDEKRRRHLWLLMVGHVFVFALLYKLRSPAIFYCLLTVFFIGHTIPKKNILLAAIAVPFVLSAIAIVRDPSLLEKSLALTLLALILSFGDFVDALLFAHDYLVQNGPQWGVGMLGGLLGFTEPLANIYAKSISENFFDSGGGYGFFILADIYVNFGVMVGIIFSGVIGYILSRLATARFGSFASFVSGTIFASTLALTRNDFGSTLREVVYCIVAFALLKILKQSIK